MNLLRPCIQEGYCNHGHCAASLNRRATKCRQHASLEQSVALLHNIDNLSPRPEAHIQNDVFDRDSTESSLSNLARLCLLPGYAFE